MLESKNTVTEIKNAFDVLISRLDTGEERIAELEDVLSESLKTQKQGEQRLGKKNKQNRISKDYGTTTVGVTKA